MALAATRKQRRALAAENRLWPDALKRVPEADWSPMVRAKEVWRSRGFLVQVFAERDGVERLSVCRTILEKGGRWKDDISWDDLQRLKKECGRGDKPAVEVYPPDADVVNVANMRHLWVVPDVSFMWRR